MVAKYSVPLCILALSIFLRLDWHRQQATKTDPQEQFA
jgi:hypothetical protein